MIYTADYIAKYIIYYSYKLERESDFEKGGCISNLKLQKLLYYTQVNFLINDKVCFSEDAEAWPFGPIYPEVYKEYQIFGAAQIPYRYLEMEHNYIWEEDRKLIEEIVEFFDEYSACYLTELSQKQKPWKKAWKKKELGAGDGIISKKSLKKYFIEDNEGEDIDGRD